MERGSQADEPTSIITITPSSEQLELLRMAGQVSGATMEEFVLKAAVAAAESLEVTLPQMRGLAGPSIIFDFDPKPDQSE